jgi:hypothetical protein
VPTELAPGRYRPTPPTRRATPLERAAARSISIAGRLGRRLTYQLKQLEAADAGNPVTLEGETEPRIGNGVVGSAGLPTRDWLWQYRAHSETVIKLLEEQRRRMVIKTLPDAVSMVDDERAFAEVVKLLSAQELAEELAARSSPPKNGDDL